MKHAILIKKGKKILYKLIYFLSANKLWVLHKYLKSNIIKNWIRNLELSVKALILFISKKNDNLYLYMNYKSLN